MMADVFLSTSDALCGRGPDVRPGGIARSRGTGFGPRPRGKKRCAHRHGAGAGRPRAGRRRRLRPPPHRRLARPRRGGHTRARPRSTGGRRAVARPETRPRARPVRTLGVRLLRASWAAAGQGARSAIRHHSARLRRWASPRWVPGAVWRPLERARLWDRETWRFVPAAARCSPRTLATRGCCTTGSAAPPCRRRSLPTCRICGWAGMPGPRRSPAPGLGVPVDAQVVAFFGFVHPVKGLRYLIEALARLRGAGRDRLHLLILGGFTSLALPAARPRLPRGTLARTPRWARRDVTITGRRPAHEVSAALQPPTSPRSRSPRASRLRAARCSRRSSTGCRPWSPPRTRPTPDLSTADGRGRPRVRDARVLVQGLARPLDDEQLRPGWPREVRP